MKKSVLTILLFAVTEAFMFAQSTGTISGTATDASGSIVPKAKVTATNTSTGVSRDTETNSAGLYGFPGLIPGTYDVKIDHSGFASSTKRVTLLADTTLTVDFALGIGSVSQQVEVSGGEAVLVQTTQSEVSASVNSTEVQNLPMLNRNFTGLVTLVPGARPAPAVNSNKVGFGGGIAVGGGTGRNVQMSVDGLDNRDDVIGGPLFNFTIEGIGEFRVLNHQFGAQYGRTNGSVVLVINKSGGNAFHGTAFAYGRNDAMTATDYFSELSGLGKPPYDRQQYGGSIGGPLKKDKLFFFGAIERIQENRTLTFSPNALNQATILKQALTSLTSCATCVQVGKAIVPTGSVPQTVRDLLYTVKGDYQINKSHSFFIRAAQQRLNNFDDLLVLPGGLPHPDLDPTGSNITDRGQAFSVAGSETWLISPTALNTFAVQGNHMLTSQTCDCGPAGPYWAFRNLQFPSIQVGIPQNGANQDFYQDKIQFKDDLAYQVGRHALKFGGDFGIYPNIGLALGGAGGNTQGAINFFEDPSVIVSNTAKYPQGFLTPGAVSSITVGTVMLGGPAGRSDTQGQKQMGAYINDDWRISPRLTLNLGLRYDFNLNWYNQREYANSRTYLALKAINNSFGVLPQTPKTDFSPRFGLAWDVTGAGTNILRAGFGVFFDQYLVVGGQSVALQEKPTLDNLASTFTNTAVGAGQLASFVYGISALPAGPTPGLTQLRPGASTSGNWIGSMRDPRNLQFHIGFTHAFTSNTVISIDGTHILGLHEGRQLQINPIEGAWDPNAAAYNTCGAAPGYRRLQCAFQSALGDPRILGPITIWSYSNRSQYDDLIFNFQRRAGRVTFQASYTLASARAWGGAFGGSGGGTGIANSQNPDQAFGPGEWGPSVADERHRVVLSGVFDLPWGIQASPIFQGSSARPYNLTAGRDCNGDGQTNDRAFLNANGTPAGCGAPGAAQVSVNGQRGQPTYNLDARLTKFFNLRKETLKLGVFGEFYNLTNRANFGNAYNGNASSATFRQPNAFLANGLALPTSRQLQLGARFIF